MLFSSDEEKEETIFVSHALDIGMVGEKDTSNYKRKKTEKHPFFFFGCLCFIKIDSLRVVFT